ncbi:MAG: hypothetical protein MUO72_10680 [Bacteroidales bacterium]|nr:hypothetical protein [Bacteroidales bacterium]
MKEEVQKPGVTPAQASAPKQTTIRREVRPGLISCEVKEFTEADLDAYKKANPEVKDFILVEEFERAKGAFAPWRGRAVQIRTIPDAAFSDVWGMVGSSDAPNLQVLLRNINLAGVPVSGLLRGSITDGELALWEERVKFIDETVKSDTSYWYVPSPQLAHLTRKGSIRTSHGEAASEVFFSTLLIGRYEAGIMVTLENPGKPIWLQSSDLTPGKEFVSELVGARDTLAGEITKLHVVKTFGDSVELGAGTQLYIGLRFGREIQAKAVLGLPGTQVTLEPESVIRWKGIEISPRHTKPVTFTLTLDKDLKPLVTNVQGGELNINPAKALR